MNSEYIRKNELQLVRESTLLAIDRNTEYLLGDEVGRQLSTTALMTLPETFVSIWQRAKNYSEDYSVMSWFVQFMMSPMTQAVSAAVLSGFTDHAAILLRELLEGQELSLTLNVAPKYAKDTTGRKLRTLEESYTDQALRRELLNSSLGILGAKRSQRLRKFYSVASEYSHPAGRIARGFDSGRLSDKFPTPFEEFFVKVKTAMSDYVPSSWMVHTTQLEQLEEELESVSRLDEIIRTYCDLADDVFEKWLRFMESRGVRKS
jgi:hypothetical protein